MEEKSRNTPLKKLLIAVVAILAIVLIGHVLIHKEHSTLPAVAGVSNFSRTFNDLNDKHLEAARLYGLGPIEDRAEAARLKRKLVEIKDSKTYIVDEMTYSVPYLTKSAKQALDGIAEAFADSLKSKGYPRYRLIVTSLLRTEEDMANLRKANLNASPNSTHRYATSFDISWKRFDKSATGEAPAESLKLILSEVLRDQKNAETVFVKYEQKEACFHITSRIPSKFAKKSNKF
ncbi:MAG: DUF5715 family protein [Bacteroidales bacterium]|nr:DUF5715 family protein [Bacteroidales bacterium]